MLRQMERRKVLFIVDMHSVHKAKKVQEWLAEYKNKIRLFLLAPYSPELNINELANQDIKRNIFCDGKLKENLLWVRSFDTVEELRLALLAFKEIYNRQWRIGRHGYRSGKGRRTRSPKRGITFRAKLSKKP